MASSFEQIRQKTLIRQRGVKSYFNNKDATRATANMLTYQAPH